MRRSICICEPQVALAGEIATWKFTYTTAINLPKGSKLRFDILSKGRSVDWQIPHVDVKKGKNIIYAFVDPAKILSAKEIETPERLYPQYEFTLTAELKSGQNFTIIMGAAPKSKKEAQDGTMCQTVVQRRRQFYLYIDPKGQGKYEDPEIFSVDIRGNVLKQIQILAPSFVVKNKRFDIIARFEDEFGNLTSNAPPDTLIELSHEYLRENLSWKLFVPETGFVTLPNLYFNEEGVYRIQLKNLKTKEAFISAPIRCFEDNSYQLLWGLFHGESERIDSAENVEACLRHFRDERFYNFLATSSFDSVEETPNELWKLATQHVAELNEDDRFSSFLGFQWVGNPAEEGIRQIIYLKDNKPLLRQVDPKSNTLKKLLKALPLKEALAIPCFTAGKGHGFHFDELNPDFEKIVEIYNAWGSSECTAAEGNLRPIKSSSKKGVSIEEEGTIRSALNKNMRFGFIAGGLDDRGIYSSFYDTDQMQYSPGLTAILTKEHTKDALIDALSKKMCYATTGKRIIIGFFLAGQPMGSELDTKLKPGLAINRHLSGYVAGTTKLKSIEIIRNGEVIKTFTPSSISLDFEFDENDDLKKIVLDGGKEKPPFIYYYLRVIQEDDHIAWSSPIWLDYQGDLLSTTPKKVKKAKGK